MVAQRRNRNKDLQETDHHGNEELIYVNKKKEEEEDELLVPVLLESMFETNSPTALHEFPQSQDVSDNSTVTSTPTTPSNDISTTDSSNCDISPITASRIADYLMMPDLDHDQEPELPELNTILSFSESPTLLSLEHELSPRATVIPTTNSLHHPFTIPEDVRYDGQVIFATSSTERNINLHPKPLDKGDFESIFISNSIPRENHNVYHVFIENERGDGSCKSCNDYDGVEESKEDDDCRPLDLDDGFTYVYGEQCSEEDYWRGYRGHYGSLDIVGEERKPYDYICRKKMSSSDTSDNESLTSLFADFFACGAFGKPFAYASSTCSLPNPCFISYPSEEYILHD